MTHGIAEQELNMWLKNLGLSKMAFATGLTLNLYSGKFLYAVRNNPSNFSCFSIYGGNHLDKQNQQDQQFILHLIETKGKGQSIKDIKDLNKQKIKAPTKIHRNDAAVRRFQWPHFNLLWQIQHRPSGHHIRNPTGQQIKAVL